MWGNDEIKQNLLVNGAFQVAQDGTSFTAATTPANSDDTYIFDVWLQLSDGNDIADYTRSADAPTGFQSSLKCEVETQNKKFGILQPIESFNSEWLQDRYVSLSFWAKTETAKLVNNIRVGILSWAGAADAITSDVVTDWAAAGTSPTLAADWAYENTPANLALTTSWQKFTIGNVCIDTTAITNLAVFVWVNDADCAVDDLLYMTGFMLTEGSAPMDYVYRHIGDETEIAKRYYERQVTGAAYAALGAGVCLDADTAHIFTSYTPKRSEPHTVNYGSVQLFDGTGVPAVSGVTASCGLQSAQLVLDAAGAGLTAGRGCIVRGNNSATGFISYDSRM